MQYHSFAMRRHGRIPLLLLCAVGAVATLASVAHGQTKSSKPVTLYQHMGTEVNDKIEQRRKQFHASPEYAKRQAMYRKRWTNPTTTVRYADGHTLTIKGVSNPQVAAGSAQIVRHAKTISVKTSPDNPTWDCSTDDITLTADSTSFMNNDYSNANSHLYPGAIFTFENFYHGSYREQAGARNPIQLVIDNPDVNGAPDVTVSNPDDATCREAVGTLFHRLNSNPNTQGAESFSYQSLETDDSSQLNLFLSGGASGFGFSVNDDFSQMKQSNTVNLTIDARKSFYSISVAPQQGTYFQNAGVDDTPDLMMISNVSYGVRVLANVTMTFDSETDKNNFTAKYSDGFDNADVVFGLLSQNQHCKVSVNGYVVGGPRNGTVAFNANQLKSEMNRVLDGATYQNARPIGYQLANMAGDVIGAESATDTFRVQTCAPSGRSPHVTSIRMHFDNGRDGKDDNTRVGIWLFPGEFNPSGPDEPDAIAGYLDNGGGKLVENRGYDIFIPLAPNPRAKHPVDMTLAYLTLNGGHIHFDCFRDGSDTWIVNHAYVEFNFDDHTSKTVDLKGFATSQGQGPIDWYFDGNFQLKVH